MSRKNEKLEQYQYFGRRFIIIVLETVHLGNRKKSVTL